LYAYLLLHKTTCDQKPWDRGA